MISNTIGENATIEARGGYGYGRYFGGAGGVVIFDKNFEMPDS